MRRAFIYFFTFCFLFAFCVCFSQNKEIDSLLTLLSKDKKDTNRLKHLYLVSDLDETIGNYDEGLVYGQNAVDFADELLVDATHEKNSSIILFAKKYKARAYNNMALIYFAQGNYSASLKIHTTAL